MFLKSGDQLIFSFKYVGTVASITDSILSFVKLATPWHGAFLCKIKGKTEQNLIQIELSQ